MRPRLVVAFAAAALVAAAVAAVLYARGDVEARVKPGGCRQWLAAPAYRREIDSVRPLVPKMKRAFAAPGLSIAIAANGKLVWSESCGFADLARRRAVTRGTQFRIGSLSKPLTAATVARLAQQERLDVDAPVSTYVGAFPHRGSVPTLRQLGGHLGGIRHYEGGEAINTRHYDSVSDSLRVFIDDPLVAPPGAEFHYSSYGFNLLGAAAESAAGREFPAAV
jgi:serine beta-lactamase-like protein LACTB, mitochondrial